MYREIDEFLLEQLSKSRAKYLPIYGPMLQEKALQITEKLEILATCLLCSLITKINIVLLCYYVII